LKKTLYEELKVEVKEQIISLEEIEAGIMGITLAPVQNEVETKYSNLDVEFEQKLKQN